MQLPLGLGLRAGASFANFVAGADAETVHAVRELANGRSHRLLLLWGAHGTGKTHLLEAACRALGEGGGRACYVPLGARAEIGADVLVGLETMGLVALDDLGAVAGDGEWERALFALLVAAEASGTRLLAAARARLDGLGIELADLRSRLSAGAAFRLRGLDDERRCRALQLRARERGFEIPDAVAGYLLRRCPRDMHALFALVERLDRSSLASGRRVTLPFVRRLLGDRQG